MRSGVILAGGRSTRFGEADKAVAELHGTPMIRRVADRVEDVIDELVVNCREDQRKSIRDAMVGYPLETTYALDETPDMGPLVGIRNGLEAATGEAAFVVACDMPFVDPTLADYLFGRTDGAEAAVPQLEDDWLQTTQAVYDVDAMSSACEAAISDDQRRIVAALDRLEYVVVDREVVERVASPESFENINSREEFDAAERRLRSN